MKSLAARKTKSRMISFRVDEDYLAGLDALAQHTSYSRAEVLRRCLVGAPLKSTVDAQALTEVARVHADLNRIGGLLKLAIRDGVSDPSRHTRLNLELIDSVIRVRRAVGTDGRSPNRPKLVSMLPLASSWAQNVRDTQFAISKSGRVDIPDRRRAHGLRRRWRQ